MHALQDGREAVEAASRDRLVDRWLAVSEPLAVDDDPDWSESSDDLRDDEHLAE